MSEMKHVNLDKIILSKDNPRKEFPRNSLEELAASIKENGLIQAIKLRPKGKMFELVIGERRFKAHKLLKAKSIKAEIEDLTDEQVKIIRLVENLNREDVHPLDEARSIAELMEDPLYSVEIVAGKLGKTRAYVASRLQLTKLIPDAHKMYAEGKIELGHALLIAKVPEEAQAKLLIYIKNNFRVPTVNELKSHISASLMRNLNLAPFHRKDKLLFPEAGSCNDCPKRTGNAEDLFSEFSGKNICTDGVCYKEKERLHIERLIDRAEAAGTPLIKVSGVNYNSKKNTLGKSDYEPSKAKNAQKAIFMDGPEKGKMISIVLKQKQKDGSAPLATGPTDKQKLEQLNEEIKEQRQRCWLERITQELLRQDLKQQILPELMEALLTGKSFEFAWTEDLGIFKGWFDKKEKIDYKERELRHKIFEEQIKKLTYAEQVELLNQSYIMGDMDEPDEEKIIRLAKSFSIEVLPILKKVNEELPLMKKLPNKEQVHEQEQD